MSRLLEKLKIQSVRSRLILLIGCSFGVFILLLTIYSVYSMRMIRNQTALLNRNTISLQCNTVDTLFSGADQYLIALSTLSEEIERVESGREDTETYLARVHLLEEFQSGHQQFSSIDGTFLYFPQTEEFIMTSSVSIGYSQRVAVKNRLVQYLSGGLPVSQGWIPLKAKGEYLFCRILRVGEGYLGVWSFADTLGSALNAPDISQIDYVVFSTEDGEILDGSPIFYER
ncbi:MAG: hypothetical protein PHD67_08655, partial [Oscillospiraceae bacterium]|nr:hypothetical protein [Oscillospiraceae bacterium]